MPTKRVVISNATLGAAGTGAGALVVWGLDALGADLDPGAAAIGAAVGGITIFVLKHGVTGLVETIWRGTDEDEPPPPRNPAKRKGA
jgi:hypothetical protein